MDTTRTIMQFIKALHRDSYGNKSVSVQKCQELEAAIFPQRQEYFRVNRQANVRTTIRWIGDGVYLRSEDGVLGARLKEYLVMIGHRQGERSVTIYACSTTGPASGETWPRSSNKSLEASLDSMIAEPLDWNKLAGFARTESPSVYLSLGAEEKEHAAIKAAVIAGTIRECKEEYDWEMAASGAFFQADKKIYMYNKFTQKADMLGLLAHLTPDDRRAIQRRLMR